MALTPAERDELRARIHAAHGDQLDDAAKDIIANIAAGLAIGMLGHIDDPDTAAAVEHLLAKALQRQLADRYGTE